MDPGALGALGVGTGFAMATKLVHPEKEVLCYYGDGSFGMTAIDMETANRFGAPYIAVIGNNYAMHQIRFGQIKKYGEEVTEAKNIALALWRAREEVRNSGKCAVINIWVDPNEYAPGTKAQTMYK